MNKLSATVEYEVDGVKSITEVFDYEMTAHDC